MTSPARAWIGAAILILSAGLCGSDARAHGGSYRGPGSPLPPGATGPSAPSGPATGGSGGGGANPATGGGSVADLTGWPMWWGLNREPYLALRAALGGAAPVAATGGADGRARENGRPTAAQVRERIVPAFQAALRSERNPDVATAALLGLAKCGPHLDAAARAEAGSTIRARLSDANQEVSETAVIALGILARTTDLEWVGDLLADRPAGRAACGRASVPARTRAYAAYALGLTARRIPSVDSQRWIAHRLIAALEAPPGAARDVHVAALMALGLVELPRRAGEPETLRDPSPTSSAEALYDYLAVWYADTRRDPAVRAYAPVALARLAEQAGDTRRAACARELCKALEAGSNEASVVRQSAVVALGLVVDGDREPHDVRARALLRQASVEGDRLARRFAWIALARASARPGIERGDALTETRGLLLGLLARGTTPERPWLALAIGVGEHAARQQGLTTPPGVHDALARTIREHTSPGESGAHSLAFALSGAPTAGAVLQERLVALRHDDDARGHAALALGLARTTAAIEPLQRIVLDSRYKPTLLREASIALGLLGDRSLSQDLVSMLGEARGLSALASVTTALGYVGDQRAVGPLLAIAESPQRDAAARAFALVALGLLGDPSPLPWNTPFALDVNWWIPPPTLFEPTTGTGVLDLY